MSIPASLTASVKSGLLTPWEPTLASEPTERVLLLNQNVRHEVSNGWKIDSLNNRYVQLSSDFDRYVTGDFIDVALDPKNKGKSAFLARVHSIEEGVWTLRSRDPKPALRVFCVFAARDVLVALTIEQRSILGYWGNFQWNRAITNAALKWNEVSPTAPPFMGENVNDYISENTYPV